MASSAPDSKAAKESVAAVGIIARRIAHNDSAVSDVDREFCHNSWYEDIFTNSYVLMKVALEERFALSKSVGKEALTKRRFGGPIPHI